MVLGRDLVLVSVVRMRCGAKYGEGEHEPGGRARHMFTVEWHERYAGLQIPGTEFAIRHCATVTSAPRLGTPGCDRCAARDCGPARIARHGVSRGW